MGQNANIKDQIDTEEIEVVALMLTAYNSEVDEDLKKIQAAMNYLQDKENIDGDVADEFKATLDKITPVLKRLQAKMEKFGELARVTAENFDVNAAKTKTSFKEASDKLAAIKLKSDKLANK